MPLLAILGIALAAVNVGIVAGHWIAQHHHEGT
jgi:uncharacterized protein YneF (UPF0154 family)